MGHNRMGKMLMAIGRIWAKEGHEALGALPRGSAGREEGGRVAEWARLAETARRQLGP